MNNILAAIQELWRFVWSKENNKAKVFLIDAPVEKIKLPERGSGSQPVVQTAVEKLPVFKQTDLITNKSFVIANQASVFIRPVFSYDGVMTNLEYGTNVNVLAYEGRFARITLGELSGWILKDELTDKVDDVFPKFISGTIYDAEHPDTVKMRKYIKDEFFTKDLLLPLQATEFIQYRLLRSGLRIDWPALRPRLAGDWHNLLKGKMGIKIGLVPKTGAILEYNDESGRGFLGYTKAVRVDESIVLESVGHYEVGEYREELIEKQMWQNWRPVWISVN